MNTKASRRPLIIANASLILMMNIDHAKFGRKIYLIFKRSIQPYSHNLSVRVAISNIGNLLSGWFYFLYELFTNPCVAHDNIIRMISLNSFLAVWTNSINSNVFHNHVFIYYRNNHKCNIYIIFFGTKMKTIQFFTRIQKVAKILIF